MNHRTTFEKPRMRFLWQSWPTFALLLAVVVAGLTVLTNAALSAN